MKLGFIIPDFPDEKRVALLPWDIDGFSDEIVVETGFGRSMDIEDGEYSDRGCEIASRDEVFRQCGAVFSLKVIQPSDYGRLRPGQAVIGWVHPYGSGRDFMEKQVLPKNLVAVDLDNKHPFAFAGGRKIPVPWLPQDFICENSFLAGMASVYHALMSYGQLPVPGTKAAVLSPGNASQGAFCMLSRYCSDIRMFGRKTMGQFREDIGVYDIIVNGIEMDSPGEHIITLADQEKLKKGCLVIDAAADTDGTVEGIRDTTISEPLYKKGSAYYYAVWNSPAVFFRTASRNISRSFSRHVYSVPARDYLALAGG